ncbi:MAG: type II toxin-antitoxin system death-on-curing family toxin [Nitrospiraceae bacterium]
MIYLSTEQVLFLHDRLIAESGGEHGVRDLGGLESALARPQAAFGDTEFYPDVMTKAAMLMDGLTRNYPFIDGNKRISMATAVLFLQVNGYRLTAMNPELEEFTIHVTTTKPDTTAIAEWFRSNTIRTKTR